MGFSLTASDTKTAPSKIASCAQKTASREFFSSNRKITYKIERSPLKTQQEESTYTYKTASGRGIWPSRDPIEESGLEFEVLTDLNHKVAMDYGLLFKLTPEVERLYGKFLT